MVVIHKGTGNQNTFLNCRGKKQDRQDRQDKFKKISCQSCVSCYYFSSPCMHCIFYDSKNCSNFLCSV